MLEIELSTIPDTDIDRQVLAQLVEQFSAEQNVRVNIRNMTWNEAWNEMISIASHGKGPDLSHLGGTWVSSLVSMNALRPFRSNEIAAMGGPEAFIDSAWKSGLMAGDDKLWAIPWTGYLYVICYRKDMLASAGIDLETALESPHALDAALTRLQASNLEIPWLNPNYGAPYTDYLHTASSWVFAAGGRLVSEEGTRALFAEPEALRGLTYWLDSYRVLPPERRHFDAGTCHELFTSGQAAAIVTNIRTADEFVAGGVTGKVRENLGVTALTGRPWLGGGSFVVWRHTQAYPERERMAVELIRFLTNVENEIHWARKVQSMPASRKAIEAIYTPENPLTAAIEKASRNGVTYPGVSLWRRIENQLSLALTNIITEAFDNPKLASDEIVRKQVEPLARRINLMFEG